MTKKIKVEGGGIKEAAKMLQGLDPATRKKVYEQMIAMNPELAEEIKSQMVTFDDLKYLSQLMMRDLLKEISIDQFALALRGCDKDLINHILGLVSSNNKKDIEDVLHGPPKAISDVQKAQEEIMDIVRVKVDRGELVLNASDDETYV